MPCNGFPAGREGPSGVTSYGPPSATASFSRYPLPLDSASGSFGVAARNVGGWWTPSSSRPTACISSCGARPSFLVARSFAGCRDSPRPPCGGPESSTAGTAECGITGPGAASSPAPPRSPRYGAGSSRAVQSSSAVGTGDGRLVDAARPDGGEAVNGNRAVGSGSPQECVANGCARPPQNESWSLRSTCSAPGSSE